MLKAMRNKKVGTTVTAIGAALMLAAAGLTLFNLWDESRAERSVETTLDGILDEMENGTPQAPVLEQGWSVEAQMPSVVLDGGDYLGILEIPSLELALPICDEWSYPNLSRSPCRYAGGLYSHDLVIAGHNYRSHFGHLGRLSVGDEVFFTDMDRNRFAYRVSEISALGPTAVEEMTAPGEWDLTLFTCTLGGRSRMTVRCVSQSEELD